LDCLLFYKSKLGSLVFLLLASLIGWLDAQVLPGGEQENFGTTVTDTREKRFLSPRQYWKACTNVEHTSNQQMYLLNDKRLLRYSG
jgi:hypothetical protein